MLRHPMELETMVEARMEDTREIWRQQNSAPRRPKETHILHHARHAIGAALIATGDVIAGDSALQDRALAKETRLYSA